MPEGQATPVPRKRSGWRFVRRTFAVLLFLVILLIAFTQTDTFHNLLRSEITSIVENNTNGTVAISEINGNFLTGISLSNIELRLKNDTTRILRARSASLRFSLWQIIFSNKIDITSLSLEAPSVCLKKTNGDSLWNFEHFLKPSAQPAQASKPFAMTIDLENLSIDNGSLRVTDENDTSNIRLMPDAKTRYVRWSDLDVKNIVLSLSGRIHGNSQQYLKIDHLSFDEMNSPFHVYELALAAYRDGANVEVKDLRLLTDATKISLDASVTPLVMLAGLPYDSLGSSKTYIKLSASGVSQRELAQFIPDLSFLGGEPSLDFEADGTYGNLKIKHGRLGLENDGFLNFSGAVLHLDHPDKLYLDVDLIGRGLSDGTLREFVPGLHIPDLRQYGTIDIPKLAYDGSPSNFTTDLEIKTSNGGIKGTLGFDLRASKQAYHADIVTTSLNAAPLLGDSSLSSDLNIGIKINGIGFDPKRMTAHATIDGTGVSHIYGFDISGLHLNMNAAKGVLQTDKTSVQFSDGSHIESNYLSVDLNTPSPEFECDFSAADAPIHKFVRQFPQNSSVNISAAVSGNTGSLRSIKGSFHSVVSGLPYHGTTLAPISVAATLDRDDTTGERTDVVASDIADLTIKGIYDLKTLGTSLADRFDALIHSFDIQKSDSAIIRSEHILSNCSDSLHCTYSLKMKDLRPLSYFLPGITLLSKGKMSGSIEGCPERMMNVSIAGSLGHLFIAPYAQTNADPPSVPKIVAERLDVDVALNDLSTNPADILEHATGQILLRSDSTLRISGIGIAHPVAAIKLASDRIVYTVGGSIEGKTAVSLKGEGTVNGPEKTLTIDSARIKFSDGFEWFNDRSSVVTITNAGTVSLDTLSLLRPEPSFDPGNNFAQRLKLGFTLKRDSIEHAFLSSGMLRISDLPKFFSPWTSVSKLNFSNGRLNRLNVTLGGTLSHPVAHADFSLRSVTYSSVTIDTAMILADYANGTIRGVADAHVDSDAFRIESMREGKDIIIPSAANGLHITIDSLPILFTLADYPERLADSAHIANSPASIRLQTRDYPIDMFSQFVPVISELHGLSDVSLFIYGTPDSLKFGGEAHISNGSFVVPYTNIRYRFQGPIKLAHSDLSFDGVKISNYSADLDNGSGILNGGFHFNGFNLDRFDLMLSVSNQLMILSDASKESMKTIYRPLVIKTGDKPLNFYGTIAEPHLDGDVTIPQAYLT
ncbi:MAG TPA: AsmA family protein, partial [Candidatus Kapabacteria bacterium]|nr:AsmA family protein [Candidatus Kapabacteria bacterium]